MKSGRFMGLFGALLLASSLNTTEVPSFRGMNYARGGYNPEFHPKHSKFKGWMRERRRSTFNKNR